MLHAFGFLGFFFLLSADFYSLPQHHDKVFHITLKSMHSYGKRWRVLNSFYMDCMRRIIGAHKSASHVGVLVRMGVLPLQYEFVYRAILWYLKIYNGESDPALTEQLNLFRSDNETFALTCFYRHCHAYIEQLSSVGGVDLFNIEPKARKKKVKDAMFAELTTYWQSLSEARIMKEIHPKWESQRLSSVMHTRYTHCVVQNLALGRAKLRWTIHRKHDSELQMCRHGCGEVENLQHVIFKYRKMKGYRKIWKKRCTEINEEFTLRALFTEPELREDLEKSLVVFFNINK